MFKLVILTRYESRRFSGSLLSVGSLHSRSISNRVIRCPRECNLVEWVDPFPAHSKGFFGGGSTRDFLFLSTVDRVCYIRVLVVYVFKPLRVSTTEVSRHSSLINSSLTSSPVCFRTSDLRDMSVHFFKPKIEVLSLLGNILYKFVN